ncbi:MAG: hypothetical protein HDT46_11335 [Ruminococcaceae bacterium]|nr:hypothetical protein [Oscillospiraceae bacterium]
MNIKNQHSKNITVVLCPHIYFDWDKLQNANAHEFSDKFWALSFIEV